MKQPYFADTQVAELLSGCCFPSTGVSWKMPRTDDKDVDLGIHLLSSRKTYGGFRKKLTSYRLE